MRVLNEWQELKGFLTVPVYLPLGTTQVPWRALLKFSVISLSLLTQSSHPAPQFMEKGQAAGAPQSLCAPLVVSEARSPSGVAHNL